MTVNANLCALHGSYLFSETAARVAAFSQENPGKTLLRLGIGDVTLPVADAVVRALCAAAEEMGRPDGVHGYAPTAGYPFAIEAVRNGYYAPMGVDVAAEDIFISDGAKPDTAGAQELLSPGAVVAVCDPVYPVYADSNAMAGRRVVYLPCRAKDGFAPPLPRERVDAVYLCSPNNPTGMALSRDALAAWVDYARREDVLLLFDAAYSAYVAARDTPRSLFQIPGAQEVGVEFGSLSKSAGFTGLRCGWTVVPSANRWGLRRLWARRMATKTNGVAYPVQRAAEAALSPEGLAQSQQSVRYYQENARLLGEALRKSGYAVFGGADAPYLWVRCPEGLDGWGWFDRLLRQAQIVCTPGEGFGRCGAGYVRFCAFGRRDEIREAAERLGMNA